MLTPDRTMALLLEMADLRLACDQMETRIAALTAENGRLHEEIDRLHDEAGS